MNFNRWALPLFVAVLTNMTACGGGSGGGGAEGASPVASLAGTAAVGAPLAGAEVTLKDANGKTLSVTADANGSFVFSDISGVVAPAMLKATGTAGGETYTLYSLASTLPDKGASGVVNVTPVTDGAVGQALGTLSPEDAFNSATAIKTIDLGNPTNCSNLQAVTDEQARVANEKIDQGLRKFKIEGTDADGKKLSFEAPSRLPLFTQASAQAALSRKKLGIDFSQWGGQSVAFTGKPDYVEFSVTSGAASGTSSWSDEAVAILEGSASVLAANALCKQAPPAPVNSPASPSCDQIYSVSTGSITRMFLSGRDPLGRGLWLTYRSSGSGGAPSIPSN